MIDIFEVVKHSFLIGLSFSSGIAVTVAIYNQINKK